MGSENRQWRRYFRDRPPSACILRGLVLEDIPSFTLVDKNLSSQPKLMSSGRESLARLHECGVLHGDVGDLRYALVANSDGRIVWIGFSMSSLCKPSLVQDFSKRAATEVRLWESFFPKQCPRLRKQKAKNRASCL